jgi:hypothetical protein
MVKNFYRSTIFLSVTLLAAVFASAQQEAPKNAAVQFNNDGTIKLRAVFDKNGGVSRVYFRSFLKAGLSSNAFFALLRSKFLPQEKDGKLTTVTKTTQFKFTLY